MQKDVGIEGIAEKIEQKANTLLPTLCGVVQNDLVSVWIRLGAAWSGSRPPLSFVALTERSLMSYEVAHLCITVALVIIEGLHVMHIL